jgi:hypothetical protein
MNADRTQYDPDLVKVVRCADCWNAREDPPCQTRIKCALFDGKSRYLMDYCSDGVKKE